MIATRARPPAAGGISFRELVLPKEHGSWSLALEPLVLGWCVAPSAAGALLGLSATAAFFARRPLQRLSLERRPQRRTAALRALAAVGLLAGLAFLGAAGLGGTAWLIFLIPPALAGGVFLLFDRRGEGREGLAEVAGAAAFGALPGALAALGGLEWPSAAALAAVMLARAVPTVLVVRAYLRGQKTGAWRTAPALAAAGMAMGVTLALVRAGCAPGVALGLVGLLTMRALFLLVRPRPSLRARTIGMGEAIGGVVFVVVVVAAWPC